MTIRKGLPGEARLARIMFRWLARRGWAVQLNTDDQCTGNGIESKDGTKIYDAGWVPFFSVRYGHTPVYRAPANRRVVR